jgi:hypothetical protein
MFQNPVLLASVNIMERRTSAVYDRIRVLNEEVALGDEYGSTNIVKVPVHNQQGGNQRARPNAVPRSRATIFDSEKPGRNKWRCWDQNDPSVGWMNSWADSIVRCVVGGCWANACRIRLCMVKSFVKDRPGPPPSSRFTAHGGLDLVFRIVFDCDVTV